MPATLFCRNGLALRHARASRARRTMRHFVDLFHLVLVFGGVGRHARLAKCKDSLKKRC